MGENTVHWNNHFEVCEYVHPDGYIEVFRDDYDAKKFAEKHGLKFEDSDNSIDNNKHYTTKGKYYVT